MNEIKQQFQELNSAEQTKLLCELIKENNNFLDTEKILEVLFEGSDMPTISRAYDNFVNDNVY